MGRPKLRVLDLFSGVGGFSLGLERTGGFETVAFCEINVRARQVLAKHWPEVSCYEDVTALTADRLKADGVVIDFITAGFPCQDISYAGPGQGLAGSRSGLFYEVARLIDELGPSGVILENVSALLTRGLGEVLGTLAALGYDAQWHCIPASAIGAPHRRDRIWIVAYPEGFRGGAGLREAGSFGDGAQLGHRGSPIPDTYSARLEGWCRAEVSGGRSANRYAGPGGWWRSEPAVGRVAYGVPGRVDRLKQLGNAVVPQIPELIGRAILASIEAERLAA